MTVSSSLPGRLQITEPTLAERIPQLATLMSDPGQPGGGGLEPSQGAGTAVLEREEEQRTDDGDADRFAHYVRKDRMAASQASGRPVVALCGKVWVPKREASNYPICPTCKQIFDSMAGGGSGDSGSGGGRGWRPRNPFNRDAR